MLCHGFPHLVYVMFTFFKKKSHEYLIGWVNIGTFPFRFYRSSFSSIKSVVKMRTQFIAEWINKNNSQLYNEIYRSNRKYDLVVFSKMMDKKCQEEVNRIKSYGGKVIFDANVNYYEIWGDYFISGTRPTEEQQADAVWMTGNADWVVADSSYIESVARKYTDKVSWVPDNVNLDIYKLKRRHQKVDTVTLIWSGVAKKANHLLLVKDVLKELATGKKIKLLMVSDEKPPVIEELKNIVHCEYEHFRSDFAYSKLLSKSDIIISPKILCNGYELGHTEYKITLGMSAGLPVVASPQQSYIEAISYKEGGIIAHNDADWYNALFSLIHDENIRKDMGERAWKTVLEQYSVGVVASQYMQLIKKVLEINI